MKGLYWVVFTETSSNEKAKKVCAKLSEEIPFPTSASDIAAYDKGGHRCSFVMEMPAGEHAQQVLVAINIAQQVGHSWMLTGDINEDFSLWCNASSLSGITAIEIQSD